MKYENKALEACAHDVQRAVEKSACIRLTCGCWTHHMCRGQQSSGHGQYDETVSAHIRQLQCHRGSQQAFLLLLASVMVMNSSSHTTAECVTAFLGILLHSMRATWFFGSQWLREAVAWTSSAAATG